MVEFEEGSCEGALDGAALGTWAAALSLLSVGPIEGAVLGGGDALISHAKPSHPSSQVHLLKLVQSPLPLQKFKDRQVGASHALPAQPSYAV